MGVVWRGRGASLVPAPSSRRVSYFSQVLYVYDQTPCIILFARLSLSALPGRSCDPLLFAADGARARTARQLERCEITATASTTRQDWTRSQICRQIHTHTAHSRFTPNILRLCRQSCVGSLARSPEHIQHTILQIFPDVMDPSLQRLQPPHVRKVILSDRYMIASRLSCGQSASLVAFQLQDARFITPSPGAKSKPTGRRFTQLEWRPADLLALRSPPTLSTFPSFWTILHRCVRGRAGLRALALVC